MQMFVKAKHWFTVRRWRLIASAVILLAACFAAVPASAELILAEFMAVPSSPSYYELHWTGSQLTTDYGATSNGDGALDVSLQTAPGLEVQTPYWFSNLDRRRGPQRELSFDFGLRLIAVAVVVGIYGVRRRHHRD